MDAGGQLGSGLRQPHRAVETVEQPHLKLGLQTLDVPRDGAGRDGQFIGGLQEAAVPGAGLEHPQGVERQPSVHDAANSDFDGQRSEISHSSHLGRRAVQM